jgi:NitT/TauT family transport system substrate-binding protein
MMISSATYRATWKFFKVIPPFGKGRLGGIFVSHGVKSPSIPLYHGGVVDEIRKRFRSLLRTIISGFSTTLLCLLLSSLVSAQSKPVKELRVPYALGGSTGFFWVAHRSGSFEKHGIKVLPIFMRGGREAVQALISRDVFVEQQASSGVITAWAQGAKDLVVIGATGNRLDYVFVSSPAIKKPADLKGKKIAISQIGASTDFIARIALRQLGLTDKDVVILGIGSQAERWAALSGGHVDASVFQPAVTLRARKLGFPVWLDFSKTDYEYVTAGPVTTRSFIRAVSETVMNFMRGLADGMDFYRDERNKEAVLKHLGEFYRSTNTEELEETRRVYSQVSTGLPIVTVKAMENMIAGDKVLSTMNINAADILDLSFSQTARGGTESKKIVPNVPGVPIVPNVLERGALNDWNIWNDWND